MSRLVVGGVDVAAFEETVDRLCALDLPEIDDDTLHAFTVAMFKAHDRFGGGLARLGNAWADRGVWSDDGSKSPRHRLARETGSSPATTGRMLRLGKATDHMPVTLTAWTSGRLSIDAVSLLVNVRDGRERLFARDEAVLVTAVSGLRYREAEQVIARWKHQADAELDPDGPPLTETDLTIATTYDGITYLTGTLDAAGGAIVTAALGRIEHELYCADRTVGVKRRVGERRAAALVEMAIRATAAAPGSSRPEPLVMILAGEDTFAQMCELSNGRPVPPGAVAPLLDRALVQTIVFDGADRPIRGSSQRCFTGLLKRAIQVRDRHCQHRSGCDEPISRCDIDHVTPHGQGGRTELDNGQLQCPTHNRNADLHHRAPIPPDPDDDDDDDDPIEFDP